MKIFNENTNYSIDTGTLNIVLANQNCIIVASDSQRTTIENGTSRYSDDCKKLFLIGKQRALSIAGFSGINYPDLTDKISMQIPTLIEDSINSAGEHIDFYDWRGWEEMPPAEWNEEASNLYSASPYLWWTSIIGSLSLIADILGSYDDEKAKKFEIVGLHAGYKSNGQIKIERLSLRPFEAIGQCNRKQFYMSQSLEFIISQSFTYATSGKDYLSKLVLSNSINEYIEENLDSFPSIKNYLNHFSNSTLDNMLETEMRELSIELIQLTSNYTDGVGSNPIQVAVIKKNEVSSITKDTFLKTPSIIAAGLSGWVYTKDHPFDGCRGGNFVNCVIENNINPVPIDGNFFYGGEFTNVVFDYSGGEIFFGKNNKVINSTILTSEDNISLLNSITSPL
ncbi:MAG: hypothetical protein JWO58_327 [Chitinophagaceae bacterium]|nr:hypothetical protein [Chitinophagaceae bacterium]